MDEVQKAVAEAEQKAFEMIAAERAKMEKTLADAKRKAQEDAIMVINEQEDSSEVSRDSWKYTEIKLIFTFCFFWGGKSALYSVETHTFLPFISPWKT